MARGGNWGFPCLFFIVAREKEKYGCEKLHKGNGFLQLPDKEKQMVRRKERSFWEK